MSNQRALRPILFIFMASLLLAGCGVPTLSANTPADPSPTPTPVPAPFKIEVPQSIDATCLGAFQMKGTITNTSTAPLENVTITVLSSGKENIRYLALDSTIYAKPLGQGLTFEKMLPNTPETFAIEGDLISPVLAGTLRLQASVKTQPATRAFSTTANTKIAPTRIGLRTTTIPPAQYPQMEPAPTVIETKTGDSFAFYVYVYCDQSLSEQRAPVSLTLTPKHATITAPVRITDGQSKPEVKATCSSRVTIQGSIVKPPQKDMQIKVDAVVPTTPPNADLNCPGVVAILKFPKGK